MRTAFSRVLTSGLLSVVFLLFHECSIAQLHYIPEPWLRGWMNQLAPGCVDAAGYLDPGHAALDTVHTAYLNTNTLDLTGIQYLHHLKDLTIQCNGAGVVTPIIPDSVERLTVDGFGFTGTLQLSPPLRYFSAGPNYTWSGVTGPYPNTLDSLLYQNGWDTLTLHPLPAGLLFLDVSSDHVFGLDSLPSTLRTLRLFANNPICLPRLPSEMDELDISYGSVYCLPNLPYVADPAQLILPPFLELCDPSDPCMYGPGRLTGHIWHDLDNDGAQDVGEAALPSDAVMVNPVGLVGAMADGSWSMPLDTGVYTITPMPAHPYLSSVTPSLLTASITTGALVDSLNDFAYQLTPGLTDVGLDITTSQAHLGYVSWVDVNVLNLGTEITTATLTVQLDPGVEYEGAWPVPATVNGNTLEWTFNDLQIGENRHFNIELEIPFGLLPGALLSFAADIQTVATDLDPTNNTAATQTPVLASWDPNDKRVEPATATPADVAAGKDLTYTIRFQNTGNYPAARIVITDTLSPLLDHMSMRFIGSSHTCSWSLLHGVLTFIFDPIYLPDSALDLLGSQGYVKFEMRTAALALNDEVANVANIFFDLNLAVITPPAVFRVEDINTGMLPSSDGAMTISPTMTADRIQVMLDGSWGTRTELSVLDITGKLVLREAITTGMNVLDLSAQPSGVYSISADDGAQHFVQRVVKH